MSNENLSNDNIAASKYVGVANHLSATGFDEDQTAALMGTYHELDKRRAPIVSAIMDMAEDIKSDAIKG